MRASFPILLSRRDRVAYPVCPDAVPWPMVASHADRAYKNHSQTLEELARRGGLDPVELLCVLTDQAYPMADLRRNPESLAAKTAFAVTELLKLVARFRSADDSPPVGLSRGWVWSCGLCRTGNSSAGGGLPALVVCRFCRSTWKTLDNDPTPSGAGGSRDDGRGDAQEAGAVGPADRGPREADAGDRTAGVERTDTADRPEPQALRGGGADDHPGGLPPEPGLGVTEQLDQEV